MIEALTEALAGLYAALGAFAASLERPGWGLVALGLLALGFALALRRVAPALAFPAWVELEGAGARRRDPARGIALALRAGGLACLAIALALPVVEHRAPPPPGDGLDVVLVVDTSDSMLALDAQVDGVWHTRLDLAREVVARFAGERAAAGDRVGLVVFGERAFTLVPLTSDGGLLEAALARVEAGMAGGATALGDALALAVKRVAPADAAGRVRGVPSAGRVVVLLTDGRSNAGAVPPDVAASLAAAHGVRVHTVAIGSTGEVAMQAPDAQAARGLRFERHDVDAEGLQFIADTTGGRFFEALASGDLVAVYRDIDALERVPRRAEPRVRREPHPEPWLGAAAALLLFEIAAFRGPRRRIP